MRHPTPTWIGLNILRLAAVVLMTWAQVAQFVAIANDLSVYSQAKNVDSANAMTSPIGVFSPIGPSETSIASSLSAPSSAITTSSTTSPSSMISLAIISSTSIPTFVQAPTSMAPMIVAVTSTPTQIVTAPHGQTTHQGENSGEEDTTDPFVGMENRDLEYTGKHHRLGVEVVQRGGGLNDVGIGSDLGGFYGESSVPEQAGGVIFALFSRIILGAGLGVLIMAQLGWPEMFLYNHLAWLGPQSTPLWLGLAQVIVAVENLRVYAKPIDLYPAWGVLAIGLLNILIAGVLLFLGRRMPKSPPAPLYFNLSQRFLYWKPFPPCYAQLTNPPSKEEDDEPDPENGRGLPPTNAHEIGLEEEDEKMYESLGKTDSLRKPSKARKVPQPDHHAPMPSRAEQDVRQGGYPTFSGGGLSDSRRQVPMGVVERGSDGRVLRFVDEDGAPVLQRRQLNAAPLNKPTERKAQQTGQPKGLEVVPPGSTAVRPRMQATVVPSTDQLDRERKPTDHRSKPSQPKPRPLQPQHPSRLKSKSKRNDPLTPINEEAAGPGCDTRGSTIVTASELGRQFPLPPSRSKRESSAAELLDVVGMQSTMAQGINDRPAKTSSVFNTTVSPAETLVAFPGPFDGAKKPTDLPGLEIASKSQSASKVTSSGKSQNVPKEDLLKPARTTPKSKSTPKLNLPRPPLLSPAPKSPAASSKTPSSAKPRPRLTHANSEDPSSANITQSRKSVLRTQPRSPSTTTTSTTTVNRKPRGVRFDLQPISSSAPNSPVSVTSAPPDPPRTELRIPGTNITLRSPFSANTSTPISTSTPKSKQRRHSISSMSITSSLSSTGSDDEMGSGSGSESGSESDSGSELEGETAIGTASRKEITPARPERFASVSSTGSNSELDYDTKRPGMPARESSGELDVVRGDGIGGPGQGRDGRGKEGGRPKSMAVLGGQYLDGGKERMRGRRRYSSIDST